MSFQFDDAVNAGALSPEQAVCIFYGDGQYANRSAVAARCPNAKLFGVTTSPGTPAQIGLPICDSETFDWTISETEGWVVEMVDLNAPLVVVYANADRWLNLGLLAALAKYGNRIKRWVAEFDNNPVVPDWADAKQYATGSVDRNVCNDDFFASWFPPVENKGIARARIEVGLASGHCTEIRGIKGDAVHFAGPSSTLSWELQLRVGKGGGRWRAKPLATGTKLKGDIDTNSVNKGLARVEFEINLATGEVYSLDWVPGTNVEFEGPNFWLSWQIDLEVGANGGKWSARRLPHNSAPLAG